MSDTHSYIIRARQLLSELLTRYELSNSNTILSEEVGAFLDEPVPSGPNCLPAEPTYEMLKALAGDPVILAASHEEEYRKRYEAMLLAAYPATRSE